VWRKEGKVYLELAAAQLDHDFVQTIVPGNGLGGHFVVWGNTDHLPSGTRALRTRRQQRRDPVAQSVLRRTALSGGRARDRPYNFARSIVGLAPIAAVDDKTGDVVIDAAPFLDDQLNLKERPRKGTKAPKRSVHARSRAHVFREGQGVSRSTSSSRPSRRGRREASTSTTRPADPRYICR
jgi:hypothetical protein